MKRSEVKNRLSVILENLDEILYDIESNNGDFHPAETIHLTTAILLLQELKSYL
jgi:hypothetical protein